MAVSQLKLNRRRPPGRAHAADDDRLLRLPVELDAGELGDVSPDPHSGRAGVDQERLGSELEALDDQIDDRPSATPLAR